MTQYRTAMGKTVDMSTLAAQNEHVRAVGNMKVNARGDSIDSHNRIVEPVNKRVANNYAKTISTKAPPRKEPNTSTPSLDVDDFSKEELNELNTLEEDLEIEALKNKNGKENQSKPNNTKKS